MAEKSYAHRDVLDKLGVVEGHRVLIEGPVPAALVRRMERERSVVRLPPGRGRAPGQSADLVLFRLTDSAAAEADLRRLRERIVPDGAIWVLTAKRGRPDYVMQETLIPLGKRAGLVDNKTCSVDDETSAIRFVIPRDRR